MEIFWNSFHRIHTNLLVMTSTITCQNNSKQNKLVKSVYYKICIMFQYRHEPHRWCNGFLLALSAVDRGFEPRSGQTKDYTIGICCFSAKHAALRRKNQDWLARNQNTSNVSE